MKYKALIVLISMTTLCQVSVYAFDSGSSFGPKASSVDEDHKWLAPDYDSIAASVSDPTSTYYYPMLFNRYERGDTTLTVEDFRHLYYGYPTQSTYRPLLANPLSDSLLYTFGRKTNPTPEEFRRMERYARGVLADEPFSLRDLNVLAFIYQKLDEPELAARQMFKIKMIMEAIKSTGTGLSEKSPWYIIYMKDAEDVLSLLRASFTRLIIITRQVEFAPVSNMPTKGLKGFYFNFSEVYKRRPDYLDEVKVKRKFEINPRYNPKSKLNILPY